MPASERLVAELHRFERLLSEAFASGGRLAAAAIDAQTSERLSITAVHQIMNAIGEANHSVSEAMTRTARGHRLLEVLGERLGHDPAAYGDVVKPPRTADAESSSAVTAG